jgi:ketosteroid isomerase-like protein
MKTVLLFAALLTFPVLSYAAENDSHAEDRKALRAIVADFETGLNEKKLDKLLVHLDDKAVMTFMTTDVAVGKQAVLAFYDKMFKGPDAPLKDQRTKASIDNQAIFHGNTIVATGRTKDVFTLKNGKIYSFNTRWVASAIKKNNTWKVVSVDFSVDPFDNVVIEELKQTVWRNSIIAFIAGLIIAFALVKFRRKT